MTCIHGYKIEGSNHTKVEWVLLNAPVVLDVARCSDPVWRKVRKNYDGLEKRSQRGLNGLLRKIEDAVKVSYKELEMGHLVSAGKRLESFNQFGVGVYDPAGISEAMKMVKEFQAAHDKKYAYDCHSISEAILYLCIWVDRP